MKYVKNLHVPAAIFDQMEYICELPVPDVKKDAAEFDETVTFPDGVRMSIQVIGPTEPGTESCWTQGVLFDEHGNELDCTDCGESFGGYYTCRTGDDAEFPDTEYVVNVIKSSGDISASDVLNNLHVMFQSIENSNSLSPRRK